MTEEKPFQQNEFSGGTESYTAPPETGQKNPTVRSGNMRDTPTALHWVCTLFMSATFGQVPGQKEINRRYDK